MHAKLRVHLNLNLNRLHVNLNWYNLAQNTNQPVTFTAPVRWWERMRWRLADLSSFTSLCTSRVISHCPSLAVKASAMRAEDPEFKSCLHHGNFSGSSRTSDLKIGSWVPGVIWSAQTLVGSVSVYCDWVRWKVGSATSISVWQPVNLSEQVRPWDTQACCWDVNQSWSSPGLEMGFKIENGFQDWLEMGFKIGNMLRLTRNGFQDWLEMGFRIDWMGFKITSWLD